jgi:catechol 2,3-dioxygenase
MSEPVTESKSESVLGPVHLTVADLRRSLAFYVDTLGLAPAEETGNAVLLGPRGGRPIVRLTAVPHAMPKPPRTAGLYHYAILLPSRHDLGLMLRRFFETRYPVQGASDHGVSEAIYLADPDGNGMEIYRDRPRAEWPVEAGQLSMVTEAFDADGVLREVQGRDYTWTGLPAETRIGHVHLHVTDLPQAERFYTQLLGFDLTQRYPPGPAAAGGPSAAFLSYGGYHHHVGINTWAGIGAPPPPSGAAGLRSFTLTLPSAERVRTLATRLAAAGVTAEEQDAGLLVRDPSQNGIFLTTG